MLEKSQSGTTALGRREIFAALLTPRAHWAISSSQARIDLLVIPAKAGTRETFGAGP
jgi:hypothetical protein